VVINRSGILALSGILNLEQPCLYSGRVEHVARVMGEAIFCSIMMVDLLEHPDPKRILTQFGALVIMICLFGFVITASMLSIYQLSHL
jgi:hypothetical protein